MGGQKLKAAWAKAESQATCKEDVNICKKPYVTKEGRHYETVVGSYPRGKCFVAPDLGVRGRPQSSKKKKLPGGETHEGKAYFRGTKFKYPPDNFCSQSLMELALLILGR